MNELKGIVAPFAAPFTETGALDLADAGYSKRPTSPATEEQKQRVFAALDNLKLVSSSR